jgi:FkbM family methyltransferase
MLKLFFLRLYKLSLILLDLKLLRVFFLYRVMAAVEHFPILKKENFKTIVDAGANRGQFSLAASSLYNDAIIHAFEPLPRPAKIFNEIFYNYDNIFLYETAIGNSNKELKMHISNKDDSSSLLEISDVQLQYYPDTNEVDTQHVNVSKLENYLKASDISSPSLLKIDVQGFELEVLKGAENLLDNFNYIYCECSYLSLYNNQPLANDIIIFLSRYNFVLIGTYNNNIVNGECIQSDFLFKRNLL